MLPDAIQQQLSLWPMRLRQTLKIQWHLVLKAEKKLTVALRITAKRMESTTRTRLNHSSLEASHDSTNSSIVFDLTVEYWTVVSRGVTWLIHCRPVLRSMALMKNIVWSWTRSSSAIRLMISRRVHRSQRENNWRLLYAVIARQPSWVLTVVSANQLTVRITTSATRTSPFQSRQQMVTS